MCVCSCTFTCIELHVFVDRCLATKVFFRQIAGNVMGVDDHRGRLMMNGDHGPTKLLHAVLQYSLDEWCNYSEL